jgi:hypothetical protein
MAFQFRLVSEDGTPADPPTRRPSRLPFQTGNLATRLRWGDGRCEWLMFETTTRT